ncbi:unnamed protein product [Symbiodinium natans]|uniref:DUF305 domain-containing protein n=1 Tax=Symbiodinium natans TaxID=878477 RepID=A0A812MYR6_9DINO|nr:unnamed protein product [Symbiodinium natans]
MREWLANHSMKPDAVLCDQTGSEMVMGCGDMSCQSSKDFMAANHEMHMAMMVDITCEHSVDFMRGMIPHHAGAILMCQVLANATAGDPDPFLEELCANITAVQYSEMAWMSGWLRSNGKPVVATCQDCGAMQPTQPPPLCEDTLPTSSFCHTLGGDLNCKCSTAIASHPCGELASISGFGLFNTTAECMRTCGHCPTERPPLFHHPCGGHDHGGHDGHDGHDGPDDHEGHSHVTVDAAHCAEARLALALASMTAAALS